MSTKIILIVLGEPNSTFSEILFKYFKSKQFKSFKQKIILIGSYELILKQMDSLKYKIKLNKISDVKDALKQINILNINYKFKSAFSQISENSNKYIENCFKLSLKLIRKNNIYTLINGLLKKAFLKKKFLE